MTNISRCRCCASSSLHSYAGQYLEATVSSQRFTAVAQIGRDTFWSAFNILEDNYELVVIICALFLLSLQIPRPGSTLKVTDQVQEIQNTLKVMACKINCTGEMYKQIAEDILNYRNATKDGHKGELSNKKLKCCKQKVLQF